MALGICPKDKLFRGYIDLEIQLREFNRCRILYQKFLEFGPENCITWMRFAELELLLGDIDRARAIYELAVSQPRLDMPELLWKAYIDFEVGQEESDKARELYERLLERTLHVKVWMSYAQFELSCGEVATEGDEGSDERSEESVTRARRVYERANQALRSVSSKEERVVLLEAWKAFEEKYGDDESRQKLQQRLPRRVKRRQRIQAEDGVSDSFHRQISFRGKKLTYTRSLILTMLWAVRD